MDKRRLLFIIIGAVVLLAVCVTIVCLFALGSDEPKILENADAVYQEAVNRLNGQENIQLNIFYDKSTTIGGEIFREQSTQVVTYQGLGTEQMQGIANETLHIGNYSISISELYADGTGYFTVNGSNFRGSISQEEYLSRYIPTAPVSAELYASIHGNATKEETVIHFSRAATAEGWAQEGSMENIEAEGTAYLDADGNLTKTMYLLSYTLGSAKVTLTAAVEISQAQPIQLPEDTSAYAQIAYLDAPRTLETACGYLLATNNASAAYSDTISCEAFGDIRTQTVNVRTTGIGSWTAQVDTVVTLENSSKAGVVSSTAKSEKFEDGTYTTQIDGGEPSIGTDISTSDMRQYCQDILVATIMLPEYITDARLTESETAYRIEFAAKEAFAQMLSSEACTTLYQSADVLTGISQAYQTDGVTCYLTVDKQTGLPTASGFSYSGTYTISELPYRLIYQADQAYTYQ